MNRLPVEAFFEAAGGAVGRPVQCAIAVNSAAGLIGLPMWPFIPVVQAPLHLVGQDVGDHGDDRQLGQARRYRGRELPSTQLLRD